MALDRAGLLVNLNNLNLINFYKKSNKTSFSKMLISEECLIDLGIHFLN